MQAPPPTQARLAWVERAGVVAVDAAAVAQALLWLGPRLAELYVQAVKNLDACRNCSADCMSKVLAALTDLAATLKKHPVLGRDGRVEGTGLGAWVWVTGELQRTKDLIEAKNTGDRLFRAGAHGDAALAYSKALRADPTAVRWAAILHNNRAAAYMALGQASDAIADCHQALTRDPHYTRAYLRRARALAASKSHAAAVRDFRRYLSSEPVPSDHAAVNQELEAAMEANRKQMRGDQQRHEFEQRTEEQRRGAPNAAPAPAPPAPGGAASAHAHYPPQPPPRTDPTGAGAGAGAGASRPPNNGDLRSRFAAAGAAAYTAGRGGLNGRTTAGPQPYKASSAWSEEDEKKFDSYKSKFYQQRAAAGAGAGAGAGPGGAGKRKVPTHPFADSDDDDDDDESPLPSPKRGPAKAPASSAGRPSAGEGAGAGASRTTTASSSTASSSTAPGRNGARPAASPSSSSSSIGVAGDHYATMGVDPAAAADEIKKQYKKLALKFHPDKNKDGEEKFKAITAAYSVLSDPQTRVQYDRVRRVTVGTRRW